MAVTVRKASGADVPEVAETLAQAFFTDPVFTWWIPAEQRRKEILPAFFALAAAAFLPADEIYRDADGIAAAVWAPPGGQPSDEDMTELTPALAEATTEYADTLFEILEVLNAHHPTEEHFYLFLLGTRPEWQSRGLGSALLRAVLDGCDENGTPAYLEASSPRNRDLYARHGFAVTEEVRVRDSPPFWCMWRAPASG